MKNWTLILTAFCFILCACNKNDGASSDDLVGVWESANANNQVTLTFDKNGTFKEVVGSGDYAYSAEGTWTVKDGVLTSTPKGDEPKDWNTRLIGGKNALVLSAGEDNWCEYELFYRKGANVKSGALKDGRYDAPHTGVKGTDDLTVTLLVKGNNLDLYIHAWGTHLKGTYKIENGVLKFNITQGWYGTDGSGWFAGEADVDCENFTFRNPSYSWVEGIRYAEEFSSFALCATDDGKDAYISAVGLTRWLYLR